MLYARDPFQITAAVGKIGGVARDVWRVSEVNIPYRSGATDEGD
jgi:hypothetical protein